MASDHYTLSGGEWGGANKGVYVVDPFKPADFATRSQAMGEWSTENAVIIGKNTLAKLFGFIGDDDSNNEYPEGHFGMYVGASGSGDLYVLRGKNTTEQSQDKADLSSKWVWQKVLPTTWNG